MSSDVEATMPLVRTEMTDKAQKLQSPYSYKRILHGSYT